MRTLNLGILAHVDAGKTSLTERLLHAAGVIDEIGSVDAGSTQTDSLALERQRGITIKSAVVSFKIDDVTVNLIDTPGHPDFIAEVERVLNVLDGAVLVISAVEGVQAQTRVLMRTLQRLRIPTLLFVNKIDRRGAQYDGVLRAVSEKLTPAIIPMGSVSDAAFIPFDGDDLNFTQQLVDVLADRDDALLAAYVDDEAAVSYDRLREQLAAQTRQARAHPVFFGSAITGAGIESLTAGIRELLPPVDGDPDGPVSGTVFKIARGPAGERIAYVRMFSGTLRVRDRLPYGTVTAVSVFSDGQDEVVAGEIGMLWGLGDIRIGDIIGEARTDAQHQYFAPPTLETAVIPRRPEEKGRLHEALTQLAEQDPLIGLRQDDMRGELYLSLYGEVQKEVIQATLADEYRVDVEFRETTTICIERPVGSGAAVEHMGAESNPFNAGVGLRIDPAPVGTGIHFRLEIELGSLPYSFIRATEETVNQTLRQGLHGWQVADCVVTMTHSAYTPPPPYGWSKFSTAAGDFRGLTPLVLMVALRHAGVRVYEPVHQFTLDIPADCIGAVRPVLARLGAVPLSQEVSGATAVLHGEIPAAQVDALRRRLPALTRGEGILESSFDHHQPVVGPVPSRPRTDHNPLDRKQYLLQVVRRVAGRPAG